MQKCFKYEGSKCIKIMRLIDNISDLKAIIRCQKRLDRTIGFVPTMGYFHDGHVSLMKASISHNDFTIVSIFVNPIQFGDNEDLDKYPRDIIRDLSIAECEGVDVVFMPDINTMYPDGYKTYVEVSDITQALCGKTRKGHFKGVSTVVSKFFNIVEPDKAYLGQKDAQQLIVIQKMVKDLNMNVEIISCPIIREKDGLAMSSRNVYLNEYERKSATVLSRSLKEAEKLVNAGERSTEVIKKNVEDIINNEHNANIEYIEIVDVENLENIEIINSKALIAVAVKFGNTRLIDNVIVE